MDSINIILAAYQGEKYIGEQIESLLASDFKNFKICIFDDGSTDNTLSIAMDYQNKYPDIINVNVNDKNLGHINNFLNGLVKTSCEETKAGYYMFCDQDDIWYKNKMRTMLKRMKRLEERYGNGCPLMVFSDAVITDENLNIVNDSYSKSQNLDIRKRGLSHLLMENKCSGCMMMINDSLVNKIKKLPLHARYHDWWIALIASAFGHISYINTPTIMYRQHSNNVVGNQGWFKYIIGRMKTPIKQKKALSAIQLQAKEFLMIYEDELNEKSKEIIYNLAYISNKSWFKRRIILLRYGYFKSTLLRNAGVFIII